MALSIVRHDITKIKADAIVNSTNELLKVGGLGVDASIHFAAGPELQKALDDIGFCSVGSAVVTDSFNIPSCKHIIHAVSPEYVDGDRGERQLLESCYRTVLDLAEELNCKSVAIPLLSAGAYGYPKEEAYRIATSTIRDWIAETDESDLDIILVLYEREITDIARAFDPKMRSYITDEYAGDHKESLEEYFYPCAAPEPVLFQNLPRQEDAWDVCIGSARPFDEPDYADQDLSFAEMCEWWCEQKHLKKSEFYSAANITKATFSNMKNHPGSPPKKNTAFACAVGLKLDLNQALDLLMRAGLTFSKHYVTDQIVEDYIRRGKYDVDEINIVLMGQDQMPIGYVAREDRRA